jgi:hypothetical protein
MVQVIKPQSIVENISPDAFHWWAKDYYRSKQDFTVRDRFSPVPYFLLCRSIELEIKAQHLHTSTRKEVKKKYWHDLSQAYNDLPKDKQILNLAELEMLDKASAIYKDKGFEYFNPDDALRGYKMFPDLQMLDQIASKLIEALE